MSVAEAATIEIVVEAQVEAGVPGEGAPASGVPGGGAPEAEVPAAEVAEAPAAEVADPAPDTVPAHFDAPSADPRRGVLWAGAAPMDAGSGRVGVGVAGGWFGTWNGLQVAGGGAEVDAAWAPTRRLALTVTAGVAAGGTRPAMVDQEGLAAFFALDPAEGWATFGGARFLVVDTPRLRVAPFLAGGLGSLGAGALSAEGAAEKADPIGIVGAGMAVEVPFYDVVFDLALPIGGAVVSGELPPGTPLAIGDFAPLFLLFEAGFTWRLGEHTSFRLGYVALATSYSWRYRRGPVTFEVSGYTNLVTANAAARVGWAF